MDVCLYFSFFICHPVWLAASGCLDFGCLFSLVSFYLSLLSQFGLFFCMFVFTGFVSFVFESSPWCLLVWMSPKTYVSHAVWPVVCDSSLLVSLHLSPAWLVVSGSPDVCLHLFPFSFVPVWQVSWQAFGSPDICLHLSICIFGRLCLLVSIFLSPSLWCPTLWMSVFACLATFVFESAGGVRFLNI